MHLPVSRLRTLLAAAPPQLRSATLEAHRDVLAMDRTSDGARLLADLVIGSYDGVSTEALRAAVARTAPEQAHRALALLEDPWPFTARHLVAALDMHGALGYIADIRDGRRTASNFMFTTGVVHLAVTLASGATREFSEPLHRRDGAEAVFLLAAARHPRSTLAEMCKIGYQPGPSPVYDDVVSRWALDAPFMDLEVREYIVSLLSARVVAALAQDGTLTVDEVARWIRVRIAPVVDVQVQVALCLDPGLAGVRLLQQRILRLAPSAAALLAPFETTHRRQLLDLLRCGPDRTPDPLAADLAGSMHRPPAEIDTIAHRLTRRTR